MVLNMPIDNGNGGGPPRPGAKPPMKKSTRNWLIIGGLAAAGGVIWYVMKSRSASNQQSASAADMAAQGIDPSTGVPYAQEYGGYGVAGTSPSLYGYTDPTTGQFISGVGALPAGGVVTAPSTNASWAQQVEAYLENLGYDPTTVAAAIGKYLTGQQLSSDQAGIVAAAQGFFGNPPQGAPTVVTTPPTGQGTGGGTTGGNPPPKQGFITAPGGERLKAIVAKFGLTWKQAIALNPTLQKYSGKNIPKGTKIYL